MSPQSTNGKQHGNLSGAISHFNNWFVYYIHNIHEPDSKGNGSMKGIETIEETFAKARAKGVIPFEFKVVGKKYEIEITANDFSDLHDYEREQAGEGCLYEMLERMTCAYDVDYDVHFGNFIFFSLAVADEDDLNNIKEIIQEQIAKAKTWVAEENS